MNQKRRASRSVSSVEFSGLGLVGLAVVGYGLAVDFSIEHQIIELLTVVMP